MPEFEFKVSKEMILKAKKRIKSQFNTGEKQPRVRLERGANKGVYRFKHYICEIPFKLDSLGRVYLTIPK